jgi:membrane protein YqaA with SNARE-associated domain
MIGLSVFLIYNHEYVVKLEHHGYLGLFLISLLAGSPLPIPTPSMILTFTLGSILNPLYIGLVAGMGNTIGNIFLYYTGRNGMKAFKDNNQPDSRIGRVMKSERVSRLVASKSWGEMAVVFLMFINPIPVTTPLVFAMGAARFNLTKFLVICWTSKTVQGLLLAYFGHFGLRSLLNIFGVFK